MLRRACYGLVAVLVLAFPALADPVDDLVKELKFPQLFAVLSEEGVVYGADLKRDLFPDASEGRWSAQVARIHDAGRMVEMATAELRQALAQHPEDLAAMTAYFGSQEGQRIVELEIAARTAFLDEGLREAAEANFAEMERSSSPRLALIRELIEANDLIEQNVAGGLNSSLAFYRGLLAGGGEELGGSESEMMADLWSQEPAIREETINWVMPYLTLAYQPISDDMLRGYVDFSKSAAGQRLNGALFAAFASVFNGISEALGRSAAEAMMSEDI